DAIRDEVVSFLSRLPSLAALLFNDRTPFVSEKTKQWLASSTGSPATQTSSNEDNQAAQACFDEQGLEAALRYRDTLPAGEPRDQFHRQ
ncbi:type VI secretion system domain-containing protein, partial [Escherichia albertii]|uniref:type VI secretion system domain-containing protein n=1 Tax=Escherichia albertii TaxID=208962 RepID=UPI001659EB07